MPTYSLSEVHKRHGEVFDRAAIEPVVVTKQSRPSHVIVGAGLLSKPKTSMRLVLRGTRLSVEEVEEADAAAATPAAPIPPAPTILRRIGDALSQGVLSVSEARRDFSAICNRAAFGKERVVIGRHGKNRVAVIPYEDLQLLEDLEERLDLRAAGAALEEAEEEGTVAWDDAKRELGL